MNRSSLLTGGLLLAAAVVVPGLINFALSTLITGTLGTVQVGGYSVTVTTGLLGSVIWVVGYLLGILIIWDLYIRPLDIRGPDGSDRPDDPTDR